MGETRLLRQRRGRAAPDAGLAVEDDLVEGGVGLGEAEALLELVRGQEEAVRGARDGQVLRAGDAARRLQFARFAHVDQDPVRLRV